MAFDRSWAAGFGWRLIVLLAAVALLVAALERPGLVAGRIIAAALLAAAIAWLWRHVGRTNRELARFIDAIRLDDLSQAFRSTGGRGFDRLGRTMDAAIRRLRADRAAAGEEARLQAAMVEEAPAAMLTIDAAARVTLANKAARKLFARLPGTFAADFADYGAELVAALDPDGVAERRLVTLRINGAAQRAMLSRARLDRPGGPIAIVSIQPIQGELSAVELAAQADLVRVLTHEIMNSMTPVVSLAESAEQLIARSDRGGDRDIADAHQAISTLARRAGGLMHFVEAYRAFSRSPVLDSRRFALLPWAQEMVRLYEASVPGRAAPLTLTVAPPDLSLDGDPDLLCQVVLNLLKNGAEAAASHSATPAVAFAIDLLPGGRKRMTVVDNGAGVAPGMAEEVFLPFFTTKPGGTGVGLSLARRIVLAHGGTIALAPAETGACFELIL